MNEVSSQWGPAVELAGAHYEWAVTNSFDSVHDFEDGATLVIPIVVARGSQGAEIRQLEDSIAKSPGVSKEDVHDGLGRVSQNFERLSKALRDGTSATKYVMGNHILGTPGVAFVNYDFARSEGSGRLPLALGNLAAHEVGHGLGWRRKYGREHDKNGLMAKTINAFAPIKRTTQEQHQWAKAQLRNAFKNLSRGEQ